MLNKEKFRRYRVPSSGPITIKHNGQTVPATLNNVSLGGAFFFTDAELQAGERVELVLILPRDIGLPDDQRVLCQGRIVRVEPRAGTIGFATEFERMEPLPEV